MATEKKLESTRRSVRKHYRSHREQEIQRVVDWQAANPERYKANQKAWRQRNRAHTAAMHRSYRDRNPWRCLIKSAGRRAKAAGLAIDLDLKWAAARWTGHCELTGLAFVIGRRSHGPYSPSIDRIDPALGYVQGNCRFVLMAVNGLKGTGTDADMLAIAKALVAALAAQAA